MGARASSNFISRRPGVTGAKFWGTIRRGQARGVLRGAASASKARDSEFIFISKTRPFDRYQKPEECGEIMDHCVQFRGTCQPCKVRAKPHTIVASFTMPHTC